MANGNSTVHNSTHDGQANEGSEVSNPTKISQTELDEAARRRLAEQYDWQYEEELNRGHVIGYFSIAEEWDFWAAKPTLISEEAIPLMNGCDPESWQDRHRREDRLPNEMVAAIDRGLKIAAGESATHKSPAEWVVWGKVHGLDQPTIKSDARLHVPNVSMWTLFAGAVEVGMQAGGRNAGKHKAPKRFSEAFNRLLDEIDKRYNLQGEQLDRNAMPGIKAQLLYVARKFEPENMTVELRTFDDYIAGVVKFKQGRQASGASNPYADLFPEYSIPSAQKN